jgi:hypothetical protein
MATISNTPRPGYVWDSTDNVWYPIGTGPHTHADYITSSSAINPNIVDAKGDIIAATAADTVARLAVGANDTVLTADSSTATGLKWATPSSGGMTLLSTTSLTGATTTISSISGAYNNLFAVIYGVTNATADGAFRIAPNGSTNGNLYRVNGWDNSSGDYLIGAQNTYVNLSGKDVKRTDANNVFVVTFANYANTSHYKAISYYGRILTGTVGFVFEGSASYNANTAISSLVFSNVGGDLSTGTVLLYGVK